MDYNKTVNLPETEFPMRAGLPQREPELLQKWYEEDLYHKMVARNEGKPRFILHDGPPFSNGYIHMGTALNKCLKDFIVRYKNMSGWQAPYVPGWDNHGMPIESAIIKQNKLDRKKMSVSEFRDACHVFAQKYVDIQREQFQRLGVLGEWDKPYLTMNPGFEADEARVFGKMYEAGYIYKGKKPVYWCAQDETALAEAEIEYADDTCKSIYVKFRVKDDLGKLSKYADLSKMYFVIWTTTTWTIPGNLAICLNEEFEYVLAKAPNGEVYILARDLMESVAKAARIEQFEVLAELKGQEFELMTAQHPLMDRESIVILGEHVTLDAGTGCVHTAPGHGQEDYAICRKYDLSAKTNIGIIVPVDDRGYMNAEAGKYEGLKYDQANNVIFDDLLSCGALLAYETIIHPYPHCWRCKSPIVYRATDQWFCSVDAFKDQAVAACAKVRWMPDWGYDRMVAMIRERADWCISRQRHWGLPIPVFYCADCGQVVCTNDTIESVAGIFEQRGSNVWFDLEAEQLLPVDFICPHCGGKHFTKETDTLDGWFDSGSTHIAAMERDQGLWPATMYLEGADQYRGWFQSSLLTAVAVRGRAPYDMVLTHGWTVDGEGKAMHKSLGNSVLPDELIPKYGADLIRLWASSSDYRVDVRVSDAIFKQLSDSYRKIRNTARFILGNLAGFDPNHDLVAYEELLEIDRFALCQLSDTLDRAIKGYENYEFHQVFHNVHRFCVVDMSNFYLDIIKDRLYTERTDSKERRCAQTVMWLTLDALTRVLAPTLSYTADEIWGYLPHRAQDNAHSVMLNDITKPDPRWADQVLREKWDQILAVRDDVKKALENARAQKLIGSSLEAKVLLYSESEAELAFLRSIESDLPTIFIVSQAQVAGKEAPSDAMEGSEVPGLRVQILPADGEKCERCWIYSKMVGNDSEHPTLCARCAQVVKTL